MKKAAEIIFATMLFVMCGCHHGIDVDDLGYVPELDEAGLTTSETSKDEVEKELKALEKTPYPSYKVSEGDVFKISVYNEPEFGSGYQTEITPDGYIVADLIGPVNVKNMTLIEATEALRKAFRKYVKYPEIALIPISTKGRKASLMGKVVSADNYPVSENVRLADFVANGKGFTAGQINGDTVEMADLSNSYVIRDGKILPVSFTAAIRDGNPLHNIRIFPQDIVFIASREDSRVIIMGQVEKPRIMNWRSDVTVMDAIAFCGGLKEDYWSTALVLRHDRNGSGTLKVYKISIDDMIAGKGRNYRLASGDIVYVPRDAMGEYNVFIRKLMPTAQLVNALMSPPAYWLK